MLKEKAKGKPVADYIRAALAEYSDTDARQRLELINNLGSFYDKITAETPLGTKYATDFSESGIL